MLLHIKLFIFTFLYAFAYYNCHNISLQFSEIVILYYDITTHKVNLPLIKLYCRSTTLYHFNQNSITRFEYIKTQKTEIMENLKQELQDLQEAFKNKTISVNEYSSMYYNVSQKIKSLTTKNK